MKMGQELMKENGVAFVESLSGAEAYGNSTSWEVDSWPNYEEWHDYWNEYNSL